MFVVLYVFLLTFPPTSIINSPPLFPRLPNVLLSSASVSFSPFNSLLVWVVNFISLPLSTMPKPSAVANEPDTNPLPSMLIIPPSLIVAVIPYCFILLNHSSRVVVSLTCKFDTTVSPRSFNMLYFKLFPFIPISPNVVLLDAVSVLVYFKALLFISVPFTVSVVRPSPSITPPLKYRSSISPPILITPSSSMLISALIPFCVA